MQLLLKLKLRKNELKIAEEQGRAPSRLATFGLLVLGEYRLRSIETNDNKGSLFF